MTTLSRRLMSGTHHLSPNPRVKPLKLGDGFDSGDRIIYNTNTFDTSTPENGVYLITGGQPVYVLYQATRVGSPPTPTVTCRDSGTLALIDTLTIIPNGTDQATPDKKKFLFGHIPASDRSVIYRFDHGGVSNMTEGRWYVITARHVYTAGGITGTYVGDTSPGNVGLNNATSTTLQMMATWDAYNAIIAMLWGGSGSLSTTLIPGTGPAVNLGDSRASGLATSTYAPYWMNGDPASGSIGMSFGSTPYSNGGHYIELRAAGTTAPTLAGDIIGTPIDNTSAGTTVTYASISPTANSFLVAVLMHSANPGGLRTISSTNTGTLAATWNPVGSLDFDSVGTPTQRMHVYTAQMGASPGSGTVAFVLSAVPTGAHFYIFQITGAATSGTVVQSQTGKADTSTTIFTTPLVAFGSPNNGTLAISGWAGTATGQFTEGPGSIKRVEGRYTGPNSAISIQWRHSPDTTPDATLITALNWGMFAMEIKSL